jgi:hypothetical protein
MSAVIISFGRPKPREQQPATAQPDGAIGAAHRLLSEAICDLDNDRLDDAEMNAEVARNCIQIALQQRGKRS